MLLELFGYLGSLLVIVSLMMSSVVKLRVFNTVGSLVSAIYALVIRSYPLALMNFCIILINIFNLVKLLGSTRHYDLVDGSGDQGYLSYFLDYYKEDIAAFFPKTDGSLCTGSKTFIVCCDAAPVGLLTGTAGEDGSFEVAVDYAVPKFRDCSIGKFLYSELEEKGFKKIICRQYGPKHEPYLKKMGFAEKDGVYEKLL